MSKQMEQFILGLFIGFILALSSIALFVEYAEYKEEIVLGKTIIQSFDTIGILGCDSNSMGLTLNCRDTVYKQKVDQNETLYLGNIYTYRSWDNVSVIHRLVGCKDPDCNVAIFKGDNNRIVEFVNRSMIEYRVTMVEYT